MPRSDRRFTGDDLLRLYCRNLTPEQRAIVDAVGLGSCGDGHLNPDDIVARVVSALVSPPLSYVVGRLPAGKYLLDALQAADFLLKHAADTDTDPAQYYEYFIQLSRSRSTN